MRYMTKIWWKLLEISQLNAGLTSSQIVQLEEKFRSQIKVRCCRAR